MIFDCVLSVLILKRLNLLIMKSRKARKNHKCSICNKTINKGEIYEFTRDYLSGTDDYTFERWIFVNEIKECESCISKRPKLKYKKEQHDIRAEKRRKNCPDEDFKPEWQGGWDSSLGCADGGDVEWECHACNLHCT